MSQEALAGILGVTPKWVGALENDRGTPSVDVLAKLAAHFGVTETWLLHGDRAPSAPVAATA